MAERSTPLEMTKKPTMHSAQPAIFRSSLFTNHFSLFTFHYSFLFPIEAKRGMNRIAISLLALSYSQYIHILQWLICPVFDFHDYSTAL